MKFKNLEMSKKIVYAVALLVVVLLPVVIVVSCVTGDTQPLTNYVIGVFGLASIAVGFYYWKAKNENLNKYAKKYLKASDLSDAFTESFKDKLRRLQNEE